MRAFNVTPHVAQNMTARRSAIERRTNGHSGYEISQRKRKRVEEPFGWGKTCSRCTGDALLTPVSLTERNRQEPLILPGAARSD
ncbi:MAG: hypothetical protein WB820_02685, partial [Rhodoplanes sp.]